MTTDPKHAAQAPRLPAGADAVLPTVWGAFVTTVVLALAFSFGNVWDLNRTLGMERHVAPLVGPAVDITAIGLLVVVPWFVLAGISPERLRSANRLMRLAGFLTLALNSGPSAIKGFSEKNPAAWGLALVEAIVPTLLIAWSHVGPGLIALFVEVRERHAERVAAVRRDAAAEADRLSEERAAAIAAAVSLAREESAAERVELAAQVASLEASLQAAMDAHAADMAASQEALSKAQADLREARKAARSKTPSGTPKAPSGRAPRRSLDEWVEIVKDRLPEWQMETPTGSVIGSALDLSSAGTISEIRKRLEADRLAITSGGTP